MTVLRTAFAIHPARIAVAVELFFPDRQAKLNGVDYVAARLESLVAVR